MTLGGKRGTVWGDRAEGPQRKGGQGGGAGQSGGDERREEVYLPEAEPGKLCLAGICRRPLPSPRGAVCARGREGGQGGASSHVSAP